MTKPCLGAPGERCPNMALPGDSRCALHKRVRQRSRDAHRGTPTQRGYTSEYARNRRVVIAAGGVCYWGCGRPVETADHLIPLAKGGTNDPENLVGSCAYCNYSRGSRPTPPPGARL